MLNKRKLTQNITRKNPLIKKKSNLHCTCGITPKRATSGEAHLRALAAGQQSFEETSQRWRAGGNICPF